MWTAVFFSSPFYKLWLAKNDLFCVNKSSNRVIATHIGIPIAIPNAIAVCVRIYPFAFKHQVVCMKRTAQNHTYLQIWPDALYPFSIRLLFSLFCSSKIFVHADRLHLYYSCLRLHARTHAFVHLSHFCEYIRILIFAINQRLVVYFDLHCLICAAVVVFFPSVVFTSLYHLWLMPLHLCDVLWMRKSTIKLNIFMYIRYRRFFMADSLACCSLKSINSNFMLVLVPLLSSPSMPPPPSHSCPHKSSVCVRFSIFVLLFHFSFHVTFVLAKIHSAAYDRIENDAGAFALDVSIRSCSSQEVIAFFFE